MHKLLDCNVLLDYHDRIYYDEWYHLETCSSRLTDFAR